MDAPEPLAHPPPAGGYGAAPPSTRFGPAPESGGPRRSLKPFIIVGLVVASVSTVLVLFVVGIRRYVAVAKTAEVRIALARMAKDAAAAHEPAHRVCPSASFPVPLEGSMIRASGYQSQGQEWLVDQAKNAGFACLGFEMTMPQYFQYRYDATDSSFTARGRGDLNGNGVFSDFTWSGHVQGGKLVIATEVTEKDTEE